MASRLSSVKARLLPSGWLDLIRQLVIVAIGYVAYTVVRGLVEGKANAAFAHALDVIRIERTLHVFVEPSIQSWFASSHFVMAIAGWIYVNAQTSITVAALVYLYIAHNRNFYFVRNTFAIAMVLALVAYYLFPTAPPRFLPEWGFVDTVSDFSGVHLATTAPNGATLNPSNLVNLYAAVPSMHVAFAMMLAVPLARLSHWRVVRVLWCLYPLLITFVIIVTANHFIADAVLGAITAGISALGARQLGRWRPAAWRFVPEPAQAGIAT